MENSNKIRFLSPLGLLALAACSRSGDGDAGAGNNFNLNGFVSKGPLKGATAFIDLNNNNSLDAGETSVTTLADGSYLLSSSTATARVVAISTDATVDMSSGAAVGNLTLTAPAGATMVTPLTTLVDQSPDLTVEELKTALGITVDPLTFNPFAAGADADQAVAAEKAAQQITGVLTTTTKLTGGDAAAFSAAVKGLAAALDTGAAVNLADAAVITSVLDSAALETGKTISDANKQKFAASIANVNQVLEDVLVSGVNLSSSDIKNALATVNQFSETVAALDTSDLSVDLADAAFGGFDDIETVKSALSNPAPTDISMSGLLISSDSNTIGTASATDLDSNGDANTDIVFSLLGDDKAFFSIDQNTGVLTVDKTVAGYDDKSSFSIVIKATDYADADNDNAYDAGEVKGKSYVEAFTIVKQNPDALVVANALTLNDFDLANSSVATADNTQLSGTVSDGTFYVASAAVKLNLKNLEALANGTGGSAPSLTLTLADLPDTAGETKTAKFNVTLVDGTDSSADASERVISLDFEMGYKSDGTDLTLTLPVQTVSGYYITSDGTKVEIEANNADVDALILAGGTLNSPSTLDLKVSSLIDLAKEYASVDLLKAGEFHLSVTATDGIELQSAGGDAITKVEMGINIVDEGEIFQASSNAVTLSMGGEGADESYAAVASGGVLSVSDAIEIEAGQVKAMAAGNASFPTISLGLSKVANTDTTAKLKLSLIDGSDATIGTGERAISFDVELGWDASEGTLNLAEGDISGEITTSDGTKVDVTLPNADADVLAVTAGANSVSGSSLSVKLDALIKASADFASIDLLSTGNYTLQVETVSGLQLFDATGEEINKVQATVSVVKDAPLDLSLSAQSVGEDAVSGDVIGTLSVAADGVTYSIVDNDSDATNNPFKISGSQLVVDNADQLNFEDATSKTVKISASNSERTGVETFSISVTDANDAPVAPTALAFSIGAGAAKDASTGYTFTATDEDKDAALTYTILSQKDASGSDVTFFAINSATGEVTAAKALANGDAGLYDIKVGFSDGTADGDATVKATIVDNIPPIVSNETLTATLAEDAAAGTAVFSITATDEDGDDTKITFDITGNDKFEVNAATGAVTLKTATLDYETKTSETFNIYAIDDEGTRSDAKEVTVTVSDANDAPSISSGTSGVSLNETALKGATAYTATATDADGDDITYSLSGTDAAKFAISSAGVVTLNAAVDYETKATYEFTVTATDPDGLSSTVDVTGAVSDRPEHPFSVKTVTLSQEAGTELASVPGVTYLDGVTGDAGDIMVTVSASAADLDASFNTYEAIEIVEANFDIGGQTESAMLVSQSLAGLNTPSWYNSLKQTVASPSGNNDVGVTGANMVSGTKSVDLFYFVVDKSKVSELTSDTSFDVTISGTYQLNDTDTANTTLDVTLDPFVFTLDIA